MEHGFARRWCWGSLLLAVTFLSACSIGPRSATVVETAVPSATRAATNGPPGPDNTGVPAGVQLTPSGSLRLARDGQVVDGLDITGCVVVDADNVTIRNTRIRCAKPESEPVVRVVGDHEGLVIEDSEIDGLGSAIVGVGYSGYRLTRSDVHGVNDGARVGDGTVVEESWIHALVRQGDHHPDTIQSTSGTGILVRGNTLDAKSNDDLNNAAIMLGTETGPRLLKDASFVGNYLNGGNFTVNIRGDANLTNVVFRDNVYGPDSRYGPVRAPLTVSFSSDTMAATGQPVEVEKSR